MRIWLSYTTACLSLEFEGECQTPKTGDSFFFGCTEENVGNDPNLRVSAETQKTVAALYHAAKASGRALCAGDIQRASGNEGIWEALRDFTGEAERFEEARAVVDPHREATYCYPYAQEILDRMGIKSFSSIEKVTA